MDTKLYGIQCLRGLAVILVVFCHIFYWCVVILPTGKVLPKYFLIGHVGVDIFFVLSGFIMAYVTPQQIRTFSQWGEFLWRRFTRIFVLYWLILFPILGARLFKPDLASEQADVLRSILLLPQNHIPVLQVGWTLIHEIYFYLIVSLIFVFAHQLRLFISLIWFVCLLTINLLLQVPDFHGNRFIQTIFSPFSLEFFGGLILCLRLKQLPILNKASYFAILVLGLIFLSLGYQYMPEIKAYPDNNSLVRTAYYGIPSLMFLFTIVQIERGGYKSFPKLLSYLGDCSYAIYLLHVPVLVMFYRFLAALSPEASPLVVWFSVPCILILTIICGHLTHNFLEKPMLAFTKTLGKSLFSTKSQHSI